MGRPTDSPKVNDIKVRIDDATNKKLLEYCKQNNITKAEAIRQGIHLLLK
ncbi:MAG: CopG family transcriptional regulator [Ruminococcus sp.]|nr:CopG family transcriptional regulator [Ruminococcus sp.]